MILNFTQEDVRTVLSQHVPKTLVVVQASADPPTLRVTTRLLLLLCVITWFVVDS